MKELKQNSLNPADVLSDRSHLRSGPVLLDGEQDVSILWGDKTVAPRMDGISLDAGGVEGQSASSLAGENKRLKLTVKYASRYGNETEIPLEEKESDTLRTGSSSGEGVIAGAG